MVKKGRETEERGRWGGRQKTQQQQQTHYTTRYVWSLGEGLV